MVPAPVQRPIPLHRMATAGGGHAAAHGEVGHFVQLVRQGLGGWVVDHRNDFRCAQVLLLWHQLCVRQFTDQARQKTYSS
jgi:hypothetical protein